MIFRMYFLIAIFLCFGQLCAEKKKIELVANFPVDTMPFRALLEKEKINLVFSDLSQYKAAWKKNKESKIFNVGKSPAYAQGAPSKIVFWNLRRPFRKHFDFSEFPNTSFVLFMWEPPTQMCNMYRTKYLKSFSKIYTWNDDLVDNKRFFKFYYPVLQPMIDNPPSFEEKKLCTMVSSDKSSSHPNELFSERRKVIHFFEQLHTDDFEFYGNFWDPHEFHSYRGKIDHKLDTIKNYRFYICYENMRDIKGYVTEKIFDCFAASVVPVYWGASNIEEFIPGNCFIDRRKFSSLESLYAYLKNMKKEEYEKYLANIKEYLKSDPAKLFSKEHFSQIVMDSFK